MAIDFSREEAQKERNYGPVPAGSRVLVKLHLERTKYPSREDPDIAEAQSGLLQLPCKIEVAEGTYAGCSWFENITLQVGMQKIRLTEGQETAAKRGGSMLKAIIESVRRIDPADTSTRADSQRQINKWTDFDGMVFPARLGINKKGYVGKDGKTYWNNRLSRIVSCTDKEYNDLMRGVEFITDGPTRGESTATDIPQGGNGRLPYDDSPPPSERDSIPF